MNNNIEHFSVPEIKQDSHIKLEPDPSKSKQIENNMHESEKQFKALVENSGDLFLILDDQNQCKYISPSVQKTLGYHSKNIFGKELLTYIHPDDLSIFETSLEMSFMQPHKPVIINEIRFQHVDQSWTSLEGSVTWLCDLPEIMGIVVNARDITKKKQAEESRHQLEGQLHQTHNMKTISALAGGIAHQFNNALTGLVGNIELLKMALSDEEKILRYTDSMRNSVDRMTQLAHKLLIYARGGKYRFGIVPLSKFVGQMLLTLQHSINSDIRVETDLTHEDSMVHLDHVQMQMVFSQVVENAAEAITENGRIKISVRRKEFDVTAVSNYPGLMPGKYICLQVEDDGKGMDKDTKDSIFEPFFTTYLHGRGLGMAACFSIVKYHGGWIGVESEPFKGTMVSIFLPSAENYEEKMNSAHHNKNKGKSLVLLVEREEAIISLAKEIAKKLGYYVISAKTGYEAITIATTFEGDIDLAILDISMATVGGLEIFPLLKKAGPSMNIIVSYNFEFDLQVQKTLVPGVKWFIQKPFTHETLTENFKKAIDRRKYKRFKVQHGAVAIPEFGSDRHYEIIDIGRGGFSFCCDEKERQPDEIFELTLNMRNHRLSLNKIPCRVISESKEEIIIPINQKKIKRLGVQFSELSCNQIDQLEQYLDFHAISSFPFPI